MVYCAAFTWEERGASSRAQGGEFPLGEGEIEGVREPPFVARLHEIERLLRGVDAPARSGELHLESPHVEIGTRDIGDHGDEHAIPRFDCCLGIVAARLDLPPEFPEEVDLPAGVEAPDLLDVGDAAAVDRRRQRRSDPVPGQIVPCPEALGRGHSGHGQREAEDDRLLRARLLQPVEGDLDVRIRGDRALDERIELRVAEGAPPGGCVIDDLPPFAGFTIASKASGSVSAGVW